MSKLTERIAEAIKHTPKDLSEARILQDALSGAFGSRVRVKPWTDGNLRALVPADALTASGITVAESIIAGASPILTGTPKAVENAERRLAKRAGPGWSAKLAEFDAPNHRVVFEVTRGPLQEPAQAQHP